MVETKVQIGTIIVLLVLVLAVGTAVFSYLEEWSQVDSFYFTATTLMTIGYGDLVPTHDISKIATVFFALCGVAVFLYGLGIIASHYIQKGQQFEEYEANKIKEIVSNMSLSFKKKKGLKK